MPVWESQHRKSYKPIGILEITVEKFVRWQHACATATSMTAILSCKYGDGRPGSGDPTALQADSRISQHDHIQENWQSGAARG